MHDILRDFGFPVVLVIFFVWNSWKREERIAKRVTDLEVFVQDRLLLIVEKSTTAVVDNTAALHGLIEALRVRPCQYEDADVTSRLDAIRERLESVASARDG